MKKIILSLAFFISSLSCFCQTKRIKILTDKIGAVNCKYSKSIDIETEDTAYYVSLLYQNFRYTQIVDIQSIFFSEKEELDNFIKKLKSTLPEIIIEENDMSWEGKGYRFRKRGGNRGLILYNEEDGYTKLTIKQVEKLIALLEKIDFGSDVIKSNE
jgi:hypothetical protein